MLLAHHLLELSPHQAVEHLVRAPKLHIGLDGQGVIGLEEGVDELGHGDGSALLVAIGDVLPSQHLGYGEAAGQVYHIGQSELTEPLALPHHLGLLGINDPEELGHVSLGVGADLFGGEHGASLGLAAGVADLSGPIPHDEDDLVAQLLELPELTEGHGVAEVKVGPGGVEAHFEA
ncbi:MAG: hypothetical protein HW403_1156 [Dehalococcoidia bacterium]|nr:hypothetical protein [Dehalococcoidia bacterium]